MFPVHSLPNTDVSRFLPLKDLLHFDSHKRPPTLCILGGHLINSQKWKYKLKVMLHRTIHKLWQFLAQQKSDHSMYPCKITFKPGGVCYLKESDTFHTNNIQSQVLKSCETKQNLSQSEQNCDRCFVSGPLRNNSRFWPFYMWSGTGGWEFR